jgi:hypothetical protein
VRAAAEDELDCLVQVGLAVRKALGEGKRVPRVQENVEPPGLDLGPFALSRFRYLRHVPPLVMLASRDCFALF